MIYLTKIVATQKPLNCYHYTLTIIFIIVEATKLNVSISYNMFDV